jgi:hypothetical protein
MVFVRMRRGAGAGTAGGGRFFTAGFGVVLIVVGFVAANGAQAELPDQSIERHLGVSSCAGSPCHGAASTTKKKLGVVQNEYLIWQRYDKHASAYTALQTALGRRIAANLNIGAAERAPICLTCHSDNVPPDKQGVQFQIADGVGCEACHGGSEKWLGPHASGRMTHADLVHKYGLYPTDRPQDRARLCLGCHVGDSAHPITHTIMGAGHPRLPFEVQTFVNIEPAHYVIDDVYRARKAVAPGVQFWAVGQALALQKLAAGIAEHQKREGAFPELVFFDCQSCHHGIEPKTTTLRWLKRSSSGLGPGLPHFNDSNGIMLRVIPAHVAPDTMRALAGDVRALHGALSNGVAGGGSPRDIAGRIAHEAGTLADRLEAYDFSRADARAMLENLAVLAREGDMTDYAAGEQATMAFATIIDTLNVGHAVDSDQFAALRAGLERCYAATQTPERYDPAAFAVAAAAVAAALPAS